MTTLSRKRWLIASGYGLLLLLTACKSAYYSAYEQFGVYKRDLLKKRVTEARDGQQVAGEQFQDALTRLKAFNNFDGGNLEKTYKQFQSDYDSCAAKAEKVRKRITEMNAVADDLFAEWDKEIGEISTPSLQADSRKKLQETKERYATVRQSLTSASESMAPVLTKFHDYVLYMKHNLNAQAIASLKGEATNIESEISRLIDQMNAAVAKADEFVKTMP